MQPGQTKQVTATGQWQSNHELVVTADESVTMSNSLSDTSKVLDITFAGINQAGDNEKPITDVSEAVSVEEMTGVLFGEWTGHFNYNADIEILYEEFIVTPENRDQLGYNDQLTTFPLPGTIVVDGVDFKVTEIGSGAFADQDNLEDVTIPGTVDKIADDAFEGCDNLDNITVEDKNKGDIEGSPWGAENATTNWEDESEESVVAREAGLYSNGVMIASWDELINDYGLNVSQDYTYTTYQTNAASGYNVLQQFSSYGNALELVLGEGVTSIGAYAFYDCASLASIEIPSSVTSIEGSAFSYCTSLASITIPSSATSIGWQAFRGCTALASIEIPSSVTSIEYSAFSNCTQLSDIYFTGSHSQWEAITIGWDNDPLTSATIHYNSSMPT